MHDHQARSGVRHLNRPTPGVAVTPQQAADGLVEVMLADGQRMLVDFRNVAPESPDIEADVIRMLLDVEDVNGDVCGAVQEYAEATGLTASFFLGREEVIVAIGSPIGDKVG